MNNQNSKDEGGRQSAVNAVVRRMGFEEVEYELDKSDVCDKCGEHPDRLYFGMRDYWDCREGEYWCFDCVKKHDRANQEYIAKMNKWFDEEYA